MDLFHKRPHALKGALAGMAGGLVASYIMNLFIAGVSKAEQASKTPQEKAQEQQQPQEEDTTQKVASIVTQKVTGEPLSVRGRNIGGPVVHYAFGTLMGGFYGISAEYLPFANSGFGSLFGSALFLAADELSLPVLNLARWPDEEPASAQLEHWAAHLVYGASTELARRILRPRL